MRRHSYVAPLLLIAVGTLFLARNVYPDLPLLDYIARFWPVVLIAWGGLRLLEILAWAAASRPLPSRGVSGSEWAVIVFICLAGVSIHEVHGMTSWWPGRLQLSGVEFFGEPHDYPVSGEVSCSRSPRVILEDFRGDARITGLDGGAPSVKVTGHKTIRSMDQARADRTNDTTPLEVTGDANNITVRVRPDGARAPQSVSATLEIAVPKGASVEVRGRRGDLEVNDIDGSVSIASDNAGVQLKNIGGDAHLNLRRSDVVHMEHVRGAVDIQGRGSDIELNGMSGAVTVNGAYNGMIQLHDLAKPLRFTGPQTELSMEGIPGQVRMTLGEFAATDVTGPTRLSSRSRDVQIADFTGPLEVSVTRGDLVISTAKLPVSRIQVRAQSGDVRLSLPAAAQFALNASTHNGDVSNEFGGALKAEQDGRRGTLRGSVGGGPAVDIETNRGDIVVKPAGGVTGSTHAAPPLQKLEQ